MPRGLIAYIYVVPEGFSMDVTRDSADLIRQMIAMMDAKGIPIPRWLRERARESLRLAA